MSGMTPDPEKEQMLSEQLALLAKRSGVMEAPARVEAELLQAFRHKHARRAVWPYWLGTAAAVVATIFFVGQPKDMMPPAVELPPVIAAVPRDVPVVPPVAPVVPRVVRTALRSAPAQPREIATDFFAMRTGPLVDPGELSSLVRMSVPRSTMSQFGLPVDWANADAAIRADVLIGQDGVARAIRFVR